MVRDEVNTRRKEQLGLASAGAERTLGDRPASSGRNCDADKRESAAGASPSGSYTRSTRLDERDGGPWACQVCTL